MTTKADRHQIAQSALPSRGTRSALKARYFIGAVFTAMSAWLLPRQQSVDLGGQLPINFPVYCDRTFGEPRHRSVIGAVLKAPFAWMLPKRRSVDLGGQLPINFPVYCDRSIPHRGR
ncbi:MAG: hypothetical protein QJR02_11475 [Sinobacteraceae bacterium]|nr:hypothetical protein [Nevskiaceae bacterium]